MRDQIIKNELPCMFLHFWLEKQQLFAANKESSSFSNGKWSSSPRVFPCRSFENAIHFPTVTYTCRVQHFSLNLLNHPPSFPWPINRHPLNFCSVLLKAINTIWLPVNVDYSNSSSKNPTFLMASNYKIFVCIRSNSLDKARSVMWVKEKLRDKYKKNNSSIPTAYNSNVLHRIVLKRRTFERYFVTGLSLSISHSQSNSRCVHVYLYKHWIIIDFVFFFAIWLERAKRLFNAIIMNVTRFITNSSYLRLHAFLHRLQVASDIKFHRI